MRHMLESWWLAWYFPGSVCIADRNLQGNVWEAMMTETLLWGIQSG